MSKPTCSNCGSETFYDFQLHPGAVVQTCAKCGQVQRPGWQIDNRRAQPKSLRDAVLETFTLRMDEIYKIGPAIVQDYLAQRFAVAYLRAETPEELARLKALWEWITKGDSK